jgi:hypothetical protein
MCYFVTLIVPTDDTGAIRVVMERHGRAATAMDNSSLRKVLLEGEHQYLTTRAHCDCGTVLAPRRSTPETLEEALAHKALRMRRRGWSETKIARAMADRRKAEAKPARGDPGPDSFDLWDAVLRDLGDALKLPHVGLFVRMYSGTIATEAFSASRRQVPMNIHRREALGSIALDEVTIFPLDRDFSRSA